MTETSPIILIDEIMTKMAGNDMPCAGYQAEDVWPWDTDTLGCGTIARQRMANAEAIAKRLCGQCPVQTLCGHLGMALDVQTGEPEGIYGGMTPEERAELLGRSIKMISGQRRLV